MSRLLDKLIDKHGAPPPNSRVGAFVRKDGVRKSADWYRIDALPARELDDNVPDLTSIFLVDTGCKGCPLCEDGPPKLRPIQSRFLLEVERNRGAFAAMQVGSGKTLCGLLLPAALNLSRVAYLASSQLTDQLRRVDIPLYSRHFDVRKESLRVFSYSALQVQSGATLLSSYAPEAVFADEGHMLRHKTATRTKRVREVLKKVAPDAVFVPASGTLEGDSLRDMQWLAKRALKEGSPIPHDHGVMSEWCAAIDENVEIRTPGGALCEWAPLEGEYKSETDKARAGFRCRFLATPGVIKSTEARIGTDLHCRSVSVLPPESVRTALAHLRKTWRLPDGTELLDVGDDELDDPMSVARVARQLAQGFWYRWDWPGGIADNEWLDAKNRWASCVRDFLQRRARSGIDSPLLVANAVARGDLDGEEVAGAWHTWAAVKHRPAPPTVPVWLVEDPAAHTWGRVMKLCATMAEAPSVISYEHKAVGAELAKLLPTFGAGQNVEVLAECGRKSPRTIACSIRAHSTGKNMQAWRYGAVMAPMASKDAWEQLLGRHHREGQKADVVEFAIDQSTEEQVSALATARRKAMADRQKHGSDARLLYARWL